MLILFDIDSTLISTSGVGVRAMISACRGLYGDKTREDVDFAGRLDPLILADLLRGAGVEPSDESLDRLRAAYRDALAAVLATPGLGGCCPGVPELLAACRRAEGACTGLLTGNFPDTGAMKLAYCGIDAADFEIAVWGDDSPNLPPSRNDLPPIGMARYRQRRGREIAGSSVVIIGDTPHDVACAQAHGCRSLAVATGRWRRHELAACGADLAVDDLSPTAEIIEWLMNP